MPERMPIGSDLDLLCDAVTWALQRRRPGTPVGPAIIQRYVRVGFAKAHRLCLLMDDYGITDGEPRGRTVLVNGEQLPEVLATLREFASQEESRA